jgi:hypothetical protein
VASRPLNYSSGKSKLTVQDTKTWGPLLSSLLFFRSAEKLLKLTRKSLRRQFVVQTFVPVSLRSQFLQITDFEWPKGDVVPPPLVPPLFRSAEKLLKLTHKPLGGQFVVRIFAPVSLRSQFLQTMDFEWLKVDDGPPPLRPSSFFRSAEKLLKLRHKPLRRQFVVQTLVPVSLRSQFL